MLNLSRLDYGTSGFHIYQRCDPILDAGDVATWLGQILSPNKEYGTDI